MAQLISQQFHAALCHLLKKEGRGAQSRLAAQQKIDKGYLNGIIKGRKPGSEAVRGKIAVYFEMTYEDMLILGRQLLNDKKIEEPVVSGTGESGIREIHSTDEKYQSILKSEVVSLNTQERTAEARALCITELIKKTADILETDAQSSHVLAQMIETFHDLIKKDSENQEQQKQMKEMGKRIENLEELLAENKDQRKSA